MMSFIFILFHFISQSALRRFYLSWSEQIERLGLEEDDEELELEIEETNEVNNEANIVWCFAGRFLTNKPIRTDVMKTAMAGCGAQSKESS
ncbi:hypothetical protein TSUD_24720 [Trifolium subterraneum]|uniref:Uncharacterized protein n=1 Tax=Trifolium subterraneum TaxID=3900 RepID=A0A2Z6PGW0_TRISU|nr:hypothetical protein TSUD_24720 [Trifolium subterraneum]